MNTPFLTSLDLSTLFPQSITYSFTAEQLELLLSDKAEALERERRALELAESLRDEKFTILLEFKHFTKTEVAELLHCSIRQLDRYNKTGVLVPIRLLGKVLYSAKQLLDFIRAHQAEADFIRQQIRATSSIFPKRRRRSGPPPHA